MCQVGGYLSCVLVYKAVDPESCVRRTVCFSSNPLSFEWKVRNAVRLWGGSCWRTGLRAAQSAWTLTSAHIFGPNLVTAWTLSLPCALRRSEGGGMWMGGVMLTPTWVQSPPPARQQSYEGVQWAKWDRIWVWAWGIVAGHRWAGSWDQPWTLALLTQRCISLEHRHCDKVAELWCCDGLNHIFQAQTAGRRGVTRKSGQQWWSYWWTHAITFPRSISTPW